MPESSEEKIDELLRLTRDNNHILHSMRRRMFWSQFFSYLYWLIILGVMGWSFYFLQPYIEKYWQLFQSISTQLNGMEGGGMSLPSNFKELLEKMQ